MLVVVADGAADGLGVDWAGGCLLDVVVLDSLLQHSFLPKDLLKSQERRIRTSANPLDHRPGPLDNGMQHRIRLDDAPLPVLHADVPAHGFDPCGTSPHRHRKQADAEGHQQAQRDHGSDRNCLHGVQEVVAVRPGLRLVGAEAKGVVLADGSDFSATAVGGAIEGQVLVVLEESHRIPNAVGEVVASVEGGAGLGDLRRDLGPRAPEHELGARVADHALAELSRGAAFAPDIPQAIVAHAAGHWIHGVGVRVEDVGVDGDRRLLIPCLPRIDVGVVPAGQALPADGGNNDGAVVYEVRLLQPHADQRSMCTACPCAGKPCLLLVAQSVRRQDLADQGLEQQPRAELAHDLHRCVEPPGDGLHVAHRLGRRPVQCALQMLLPGEPRLSLLELGKRDAHPTGPREHGVGLRQARVEAPHVHQVLREPLEEVGLVVPEDVLELALRVAGMEQENPVGRALVNRDCHANIPDAHLRVRLLELARLAPVAAEVARQAGEAQQLLFERLARGLLRVVLCLERLNTRPHPPRTALGSRRRVRWPEDLPQLRHVLPEDRVVLAFVHGIRGPRPPVARRSLPDRIRHCRSVHRGEKADAALRGVHGDVGLHDGWDHLLLQSAPRHVGWRHNEARDPPRLLPVDREGLP
mmetsp:Transcript_22436/g.64504  ORF Transcript_22436/g.64504 Transcript_22436/m.64504 type:complete len:640 (-) Transcript_22436:296-2215(-)